MLQLASSLPLPRIRRPQRIIAALTRPPPFTLRLATLHPSLRRHLPITLLHGNLPSSSCSSSNCARAAAPHFPLVQVQLPSVKLLTIQQRVKRQPTTISSSNGTPIDLFPILLRTFDTRQPTTRPTAHGTAPPKHHVVQKRHTQERQIVTVLLPIELSGVAVVGKTALPPVGFTVNVII
jgi:hypothetical protein